MPLKTLGRRVRQERKRANLTLEQLADLAGISTSFMGYIERGERTPGLQTVNKLAKALGMSFAELFVAELDLSANPVRDGAKEFSQLIRSQSAAQIKTILKIVRMYIKTAATPSD